MASSQTAYEEPRAGEEEGSGSGSVEWWDRDTDELRSVDSAELRAARPNRWRGAPSTWRALTESDRLVAAALENLRRGDLGVHLYNAFALRRRGEEGKRRREAEGEEGQEEEEEGNDWVPPKVWTAWPMPADQVPDEDWLTLPVGEDGGDEDVFTVRSRCQRPAFASSTLEDVMSATVLKLAKERFRRRVQRGFGADGSRNNSAATGGEEERARQGGQDSGEEEEHRMKLDEDASPPLGEEGEKTRGYIPVVSAADDVSYELLRPDIRHILSTLDRTLTVLHNARVAGVASQPTSSSSSSSSSGSDDASSSSSEPERGRRRGSRTAKSIPRSASTTTTSRPPGAGRKPGSGRPRSTAPRITRPKSGSRRGRPRKLHMPLEGETEREMLVRVARESHRRLPAFSDEDEGERTEEEDGGFITSEEEEDDDDERERRRKRRRESRSQRKRRRKRARRGSSATATATATGTGFTTAQSDLDGDDGSEYRDGQEEHMERWGLRDWRDVLGAAALGGFAPGAVARAARRCADLFGGAVEMHTLEEVPSVGAGVTSSSLGAHRGRGGSRSRGKSAVTTAVYEPRRSLAGPASYMPSSSDDEEESEEGGGGGEDTKTNPLLLLPLEQARALGRQSSASLAPRTPRRRRRSPLSLSSPTPAPPSLPSSQDEGSDADDVHSPSERGRKKAKPSSRSRQPRLKIPPPTHRHHASHFISSPVFPPSSSPPSAHTPVHAPRFFCPVRRCVRAARGFTRRPNLLRHVRLVHPLVEAGDIPEAGVGGEAGLEAATEYEMTTEIETEVEEEGEEEEEEEETYGGVHVDGFLRPIRVRRGWRGGDAGSRSRSRSAGRYTRRSGQGQVRRGRGRKEEEDGTDEDTDDEGLGRAVKLGVEGVYENVI